MKPMDLGGFAGKFRADPDPWATFAKRDEAVKRRAIVHALGAGPIGRVLELASGNGSNSVDIARRALRLDATEGTAEGTRLTAANLDGCRRARASQLVLPARPPRPIYDAIVIAELLYYLNEQAMGEVARDVSRALRGGGRLILAHHRIDFYDFTQHARHIHRRFLEKTMCSWTIRSVRRTQRWSVIVATVDISSAVRPLWPCRADQTIFRENEALKGRC